MTPLAPQGVAAERVRAELESVFAEPEFDRSPGALQRFLEWLSELFDLPSLDLGDGSGLLAFGRIVGIAALAVLLAWIAWSVRRAWLPSAGRAAAAADPVRDRVEELRARAAAAESAGDLLLALRLYFFALVVGLGRRGELAYRDAWTNRELLERGRPSPDVTRALGPLVGELDSMSFGARAVAAADVRRFQDLCDRWLGGDA